MARAPPPAPRGLTGSGTGRACRLAAGARAVPGELPMQTMARRSGSAAIPPRRGSRRRARRGALVVGGAHFTAAVSRRPPAPARRRVRGGGLVVKPSRCSALTPSRCGHREDAACGAPARPVRAPGSAAAPRGRRSCDGPRPVVSRGAAWGAAAAGSRHATTAASPQATTSFSLLHRHGSRADERPKMGLTLSNGVNE